MRGAGVDFIELLTVKRFARFKNSNLLAFGHPFIELESVDSSNNYAMEQIQAGKASHGTIFFAHEQWAGKGQRGRRWASQRGENILMSVVLEPVFLPVTNAFPLSMAVALACHDFFSLYAGPDQTRIKWPNDLYWCDRKAGGILIENSSRGHHWLFAVVGIGININQVAFSEDLKNPVSLRQITGRRWEPVKLARELGASIGHRFEELAGGANHLAGGANDLTDAGDPVLPGGHATLLAEYNRRLYGLGADMRLKKDSAVFTTNILGVSPTGELLTRDTLDRSFTFGEVEWL